MTYYALGPSADVDLNVSNETALRPMMWMFIAILVTFLITRAITRKIRSGSARGIGDISLGGNHIHHQVFGILIMVASGILLVSATPEGRALDATAALFGVGIGLTLDEFALWVHMKDVYWEEEGRKSVDAIFCVLAVVGLLVGGSDFLPGEVGSSGWWSSVGLLAVNLVLSIICLLKGKMVTGIVGIVIVFVAIIGVIRLAKPGSWWARRHYTKRPKRLARAEVRYGAKYDARWNRLRDFVAGSPTSAD